MNRLLLGVVGALFGCGGATPTKEEVADAKGRVQAAVEAADQARDALELLGILPVYECGEPRATFVGKAVDKVKVDVVCATAQTESLGAAADGVRVTFPSDGCEVKGRKLTGHALFRYSGGESRMDLEVDFRELLIDGKPLQAKGGYGTCGDEKRYWALAEGSLPSKVDQTFKVDGRVAKRDGLPVIGGTTLILDGPGEVTHAAGTDRATFTELVYEVGEYLPKEGTLLVETSSGRRVRATFKSTLWRLGEAEITIDDGEPTKVPIVQ